MGVPKTKDPASKAGHVISHVRLFVFAMQAHAGICEEVYCWLERLLGYHRQLTDFLARLAGGAFIHASVESLLLVRSRLCIFPFLTHLSHLCLSTLERPLQALA